MYIQKIVESFPEHVQSAFRKIFEAACDLDPIPEDTLSALRLIASDVYDLSEEEFEHLSGEDLYPVDVEEMDFAQGQYYFEDGYEGYLSIYNDNLEKIF